MKTCKDKALEWGISERTVNGFCKSGKIAGATKVGSRWQIPDDAKKPEDMRISSGKYLKPRSNVVLKSLPVGIADYKKAQSTYYYVDKTLLIKEFLDRKPMVSLFTRPRRFGKTLNMDMLRVFFEMSEEDTSIYFKNTAIWKCGSSYTSHQGKYPVIFLSFKDVKYNSWEETLDKIKNLLQVEFKRHKSILLSESIDDFEREYYQRILDGKGSYVEMTYALEVLSRLLHGYYHTSPIIIIDEYDTPIQSGYSKDFYNEIIDFMRLFFSGAFKDNKNLSYGFLTGILRIAQESIFSGLNNLSVDSVFDEDYAKYFGFTNSEVEEMLSYYGVSSKISELKEWYDGYIFGETKIYNPWSVISYVAKKCKPQAYWANTGKNEVLIDVLNLANKDIEEELRGLLLGERAFVRIDQNVVYRSLAEEPDNVFSILLVAGYLKAHNKIIQADGSYFCEVSIPNKEIEAVYKNEIMSHLLHIGAITRSTANKISESLITCNHSKLQKALLEYLNRSVSFYDGGAEGFYHGLVLGLISLMDERYSIKSNRESGEGRYDITMYPKVSEYPGIIMEFKWQADLTVEAIEKLAVKALKQIDEKRYDTDLVEMGISPIYKFGIAFSGKKVIVKTL